MSDVSMTRETAGLLCEALQRRLELVEERLGRSSVQQPAFPRAADPEEALRELMVTLWPRVRQGTATDAERARFREMLGTLWMPALAGDLRFLDAWNNAFETAADELDQPLLSAYADLLKAFVATLDPGAAQLNSTARRPE